MQDRTHQYRRTSIDRAIKTVVALQDDNGVTVSELADILEFASENPATRYHSAMRWIDSASTVLPVVELGERWSKDSENGSKFWSRKAVAYGIIK